MCVRSRACASVRLNPIIRPRPSSYVHVRLRPCPYVCVRACTSASVPIRLRPCPYVCVRALASAFVRVRASAFVCVHIIKSPDASARIISNASGRVFRSRTFEVYYKSIMGEKTVICGRSASWWDEEIKGKIKQRREVYKRFRLNGDSKLWTKYCKLRKEMKRLVIEKKLNMWNNVVKKANQDFEGNKKQFWYFVGRTKCKNKTISSLKSEVGISISSTKGTM